MFIIEVCVPDAHACTSNQLLQAAKRVGMEPPSGLHHERYQLPTRVC